MFKKAADPNYVTAFKMGLQKGPPSPLFLYILDFTSKGETKGEGGRGERAGIWRQRKN